MSVSVASGVAERQCVAEGRTCSGRLYLQQKAVPAAEGCAVTEAAGYLDRQHSQTKST